MEALWLGIPDEIEMSTVIAHGSWEGGEGREERRWKQISKW